MVAGCLATKLKDHQRAGIRFLWKNVVLEHEVEIALHICVMLALLTSSGFKL